MSVYTRTYSIIFHIKRAMVVFSEFGTREFLLRLLRAFGFRNHQFSAWADQKARADVEFDSKFGTETGGVQHLVDQYEVVGENAKYGLAHIATDPTHFADVMNTLRLPTSDFTFVDLGCGKGRALLLAAQYPFTSVIGVEFVPAFVESARENLQRAAVKGLQKNNAVVILADATQFPFPPGPILVYLFNPFDSHIIRQVARNAYASWQSNRRPFIVVYVNPIHSDDFLNCGWRMSKQGNGWQAFDCEDHDQG